MRKVLSDLFKKQSDFEVAATARNGKEAIEKVKELKPDLLTLDVNMPVMDGLNALAVIMDECPLPVVMLSSLTQEGTEATVRALALGAVDFISKAGASISRIDSIEPEILTKCRNAARAHVHKFRAGGKAESMGTSRTTGVRHIELPQRHGYRAPTTAPPGTSAPAGSAYGSRRQNPLLLRKEQKQQEEQQKVRAVHSSSGGSGKLVAIGTSTGGPQALQNVITRLPGDLPCGVVVVQHMPAGFTKALADRLNNISAIAVKEAEDGEVIKPGHVYIAPGNYHMRVKGSGGVRKIALSQEPPVGNHRPAVNVMYDSVASIGRQLVSVIMTGMGSDGCEGMKKIKANGGYCIAQDEATCVVYGMPKAVVDAGLADEVKPVELIARAIVEAVKR